MDTILYLFTRGVIAMIQSLPLGVVARLGRFLGILAYYLDGRHRRVTTRNLAMCFGKEKSPAEIRALARETFRRIGENFASAIKTLSMSPAQMAARVEVINAEAVRAHSEKVPSSSIVLAIGHFGNFEAFAQTRHSVPKHRLATTYRAIRQPGVNRLLLELRQRTGALYFERRTEGAALRAALREQNVILGLLADQHSGDHGLRLPFLGHDCNTSKAPAVFALRFNVPLFAAVCFRTRIGHWRIEVSDEIPTSKNGEPRSLEAIMLDVNQYFEQAVRRDPANWFWVHNRWKQSKLVKSPKAASRQAEPDINVVEDQVT